MTMNRSRKLPCPAALLLALPATASAQSTAVADYSHWGINAVVVVATGVVVSLCVVLHYEALNAISRWLAHRQGRPRHRVLLAIFGMLSVHVAEIWIFGLATMLLLISPRFGVATGVEGGVLDHIYLSAMTFTTVGAVEMQVAGPIRFLNGMEALTGLVLITWSASFTFLEMERFWRER